jgi:transposase-like protein
MARGQQLSDELRENIIAALASNNNVREIARQFKVSPASVMKYRDEKPDEFEQLRTDKKTQMIDKIWSSLVDAADLGHSMILEAKNKERDIPLNQISTYYGTLYDKMALMKGESTSNTNVNGTMNHKHIADLSDEDLEAIVNGVIQSSGA